MSDASPKCYPQYGKGVRRAVLAACLAASLLTATQVSAEQEVVTGLVTFAETTSPEIESSGASSPESPTASAAAASGPAAQTAPRDTSTWTMQRPMRRIATIRNRSVNSPKSVCFSPDGARFYVNALEGRETLVFNARTLAMEKVISHRFRTENAGLFAGEDSIFDYEYLTEPSDRQRNCFEGRPVEFTLTHGGRYLWVTYYRRDWDRAATSPSAVAVIDTTTDEIVRVMPTGPLPKMVTASPDGSLVAITHWGANTVALIDIGSDRPEDFRYVRLLESGARPDLRRVRGDRDRVCGQCLRGTAFSKDGRYLFVGRMHGGGISVFDTQTGELLGTLLSVASTPRHLVLSPDGRHLYVSSGTSGVVTDLEVERVIECVSGFGGKAVGGYRGREVRVASAARTVTVSEDGRFLYVVCNLSSKIFRIDVQAWKVTDVQPVDPYAVGVAVSPDGTLLVTTSQGRGGRGGHVLCVYDSGLAPSDGTAGE